LLRRENHRCRSTPCALSQRRSMITFDSITFSLLSSKTPLRKRRREDLGYAAH
jgi:hypothetical protein